MKWYNAIKINKLKPGKKKMIRVAKKLILIGKSIRVLINFINMRASLQTYEMALSLWSKN